MQQVLFDNADQPRRRIGARDSERIGDFRIDGFLRRRQVERDGTARIRPRPHAPQHEMGVGYRRARAAMTVGRRTGPRAGAFGPGIHQAGRIDARDGAAARADSVNIDRRGDQIVIVDRQRIRDRDAAFMHQHHVATRAADFHADQVVFADPGGKVLHRADTGGRAGQQQVHRLADKLVERGRAAIRLQHQQLGLQPHVDQLLLQRREVGCDPRHDIGVHRRGRRAFVFAHHRHDIGRNRNPFADVFFPQDVGNRVFVGRIDEAVDQADGDGFDAVIGKNPAGGAYVIGIEGFDLGTVGGYAPGDRLAQIARHQHRRIGRAVIPRILAQAAPRFEAVAETLRRQQANPRPLAFEQGVGGHGGAVQEKLAVAQELCHRLVERGAGRNQRIDHALARIGGHRRHLEHVGAALAVGNDKIGERAADIDADAPRG